MKVVLSITVVQTAVHYPVSFKCICSAGLFPGTEYQISVQAIRGTTEGKTSSVNGATGQCQHISTQHPAAL